jgi:hypothetical protein
MSFAKVPKATGKGWKFIQKHCDPDLATVGSTRSMMPSCVDLLANTGMGAMGVADGEIVGSVVQMAGDAVIDSSVQISKNSMRGITYSYATNAKAAKAVYELAETSSKQASKEAIKAASRLAKDGASTALKAAASKADDAAIAAAKLAKAAAEKLATALFTRTTAKTATSMGFKIASGLIAAAPTGPGILVELAIIVFQVTGMIIDMFWDPFKTYFNKDLDEMKETVDASVRKQALKRGYEYPLDVKPNVMPQSQEKEDEYMEYINTYYINNSLIPLELAAQREELWRSLAQFKRSEIHLNSISDLASISSTQQSIALLAAVAIIRRNNAKMSKALDVDFKTYQPDKYRNQKEFVQYNWQMFLLITICIFLIFSSISSIATVA